MVLQSPSLEQLHRECMLRLAAATGNLRMLAIGAPFASDLIDLAEDDVRAALDATRQAEQLRAAIALSLSVKRSEEIDR
jgi:hypothetical protein